ncbi:OmpA family protein [Vibrio sp. Isolate33]|uniref:OmpA family protein n=1 Tax=Vibrio sp. Isolate33 TaxID=2908539 RepID=UPI001EFEB715|nr:OmpA family protein [Vibrio sp. Isolate33]MCG9543703.1 OmpA family protein [Vibrio sp. Isolate33]
MNRNSTLSLATALVLTAFSAQSEPQQYYCDTGVIEFQHAVDIGAVTGIGTHRQGYLVVEAYPDGNHVQQVLLDKVMQTRRLGDCNSFVASPSMLNDQSPVAMRVNFAFDSDAITPMAQRTLEHFSLGVAEAEQKLVVEGHTDAIGTEEYNQGLGFRRADQTAKVLKKEGVPSQNLTIKSLGETQPIASNHDKQGRALNRRADVVIE